LFVVTDANEEACHSVVTRRRSYNADALLAQRFGCRGAFRPRPVRHA